MKKPKAKAMKRITEVIDLPSDVLLDLPKIVYDGIGKVSCNNYKEIIEYSSTCLRFTTKTCEVKILGNNLKINEFICGSIICSGEIKSTEFIQKNAHKSNNKINKLYNKQK